MSTSGTALTNTKSYAKEQRTLSACGACLCQAERLARAKRSFNRCQRSLLQQSLKWNERQLLWITLTSPILFLFIENIL